MRRTRILLVALHNPRSETDRVEKNLDSILRLLNAVDSMTRTSSVSLQ